MIEIGLMLVVVGVQLGLLYRVNLLAHDIKGLSHELEMMAHQIEEVAKLMVALDKDLRE